MTSSFRILPEADGYLLARRRTARQPSGRSEEIHCLLQGHHCRRKRRVATLGLGHCDALPAELAALLPEENDAIRTHEHLLAIRLPGARAELWTRAAQADELGCNRAVEQLEGSLNDWRLAQIRCAGIGQVVGATRELFIPQMINLQLPAAMRLPSRRNGLLHQQQHQSQPHAGPLYKVRCSSSIA